MRNQSKILIGEEQPSLAAAIEYFIGVLSDTHLVIDDQDPVLFRLQSKIPSTNLLEVLLAAESPEKFYWSDRKRVVEWMGLGTSIKITDDQADFQAALEGMRSIFEAIDSDILFFGGSRFDAKRVGTDKSWEDFPALCFVLSTLEIKSDAMGTTCALNVLTKSDSEVERALTLLCDLLQAIELPSLPSSIPRANKENQTSDAAKWGENVALSAELLSKNVLDKIVLANAHDFWMDAEVDPVQLLIQLDEKSPSTYRFLMQLSNDAAFVGASPEQLFARNELRIESEAQAGTRARGASDAEDIGLALELLNSQKEFIEHNLVFQDIEKKLSPLCRDSGWVDERKIIKLSHVQHLLSRFAGILNDGVSDADLLDVLHPTPAVCGRPKQLAQGHIRHFEEFDRGYYCGPIGMVGSRQTELAVALRSALIKKNHVRIYAGAGLVKGSRAKDEWNEIESKMRLYYDIFRK